MTKRFRGLQRSALTAKESKIIDICAVPTGPRCSPAATRIAYRLSSAGVVALRARRRFSYRNAARTAVGFADGDPLDDLGQALMRECHREGDSHLEAQRDRRLPEP